MDFKKGAAIVGIVGAFIALGFAVYNYFSLPSSVDGRIDSLEKAREAKRRKADELKDLENGDLVTQE